MAGHDNFRLNTLAKAVGAKDLQDLETRLLHALREIEGHFTRLSQVGPGHKRLEPPEEITGFLAGSETGFTDVTGIPSSVPSDAVELKVMIEVDTPNASAYLEAREDGSSETGAKLRKIYIGGTGVHHVSLPYPLEARVSADITPVTTFKAYVTGWKQ